MVGVAAVVAVEPTSFFAGCAGALAFPGSFEDVTAHVVGTETRYTLESASATLGGGTIDGSGTIESGCKQIGTQRMKVPGATWSLEGARRTAKARAAMLSGQWDYLASRREHLPRAA